MKKLKLFLLWSIITLLGIWSFSSAKSYTFISDWSSYTPDVASFDVALNTLEFSSFKWVSPNSNACYIKFYNISDPISSCNIAFMGNWNIVLNNCTRRTWKSFWVGKDWNNQMCNSVYITDWVPDPFSMVDNMSPAITGLRDTVFELIPYVVYIWIWMLVVTLWFYAIRRLVNWVSWKVNSNFKSKR